MISEFGSCFGRVLRQPFSLLQLFVPLPFLSRLSLFARRQHRLDLSLCLGFLCTQRSSRLIRVFPSRGSLLLQFLFQGSDLFGVFPLGGLVLSLPLAARALNLADGCVCSLFLRCHRRPELGHISLQLVADSLTAFLVLFRTGSEPLVGLVGFLLSLLGNLCLLVGDPQLHLQLGLGLLYSPQRRLHFLERLLREKVDRHSCAGSLVCKSIDVVCLLHLDRLHLVFDVLRRDCRLLNGKIALFLSLSALSHVTTGTSSHRPALARCRWCHHWLGLWTWCGRPLWLLFLLLPHCLGKLVVSTLQCETGRLHLFHFLFQRRTSLLLFSRFLFQPCVPRLRGLQLLRR
mmetsp:Transcript_65193/g.142166  ORF Transcript_65193/g.142166 Transcript_65193/m.142166 type:complete len:345 (-) Transcript_65193:241-1275(-)